MEARINTCSTRQSCNASYSNPRCLQICAPPMSSVPTPVSYYNFFFRLTALPGTTRIGVPRWESSVLPNYSESWIGNYARGWWEIGQPRLYMHLANISSALRDTHKYVLPLASIRIFFSLLYSESTSQQQQLKAEKRVLQQEREVLPAKL